MRRRQNRTVSPACRHRCRRPAGTSASSRTASAAAAAADRCCLPTTWRLAHRHHAGRPPRRGSRPTPAAALIWRPDAFAREQSRPTQVPRVWFYFVFNKMQGRPAPLLRCNKKGCALHALGTLGKAGNGKRGFCPNFT